MPTEIPNIPVDPILDPSSIDLTDEANEYPLLEDLVTADSVGPESINRQPRALDVRTETLRVRMNLIVDAINALNTNLLHRDGADAVIAGSPAPSGMRGNLSMRDPVALTSYRVTDVANGVADTDAVTKAQLDVLSSFLTSLNGDLTQYLRRDGTLAMNANLDMGNNQAINLADPINPADAVTKQYADTRFGALETGFLKADGSVAMTGDLNMGGNKVVNLDLNTPTSDGDAVTRAYLLSVLSTVAETPPGTIVWFAGDASGTVPTGWLVSDGRVVSRTTYSALFSAIGTQYNIGGESVANFRLPDYRGRVPIGMDNMGSGSANVITDPAADILGGTLGVEEHVLTSAQMPAHTHTYTDEYIAGDSAGSRLGPDTTDANNEFNETPGRVTGSQGSDQAHPNIQPSMALYVLIKA